MILVAAILFAAVLFFDLRIDYRKWKKDIVFAHKNKWKRGLFLMPSIVLLAFPLPGSIIFGLIYSLALVGFVYWTLFDGVYNIIRREPWNYIGVPDQWDAGLDKPQRKYPWLWIAKMIISTALIIIYVRLFDHITPMEVFFS